jgi:hypothetical protein
MTGAYLFSRKPDGSRGEPKEVEHLTPEDRRHHLKDRDPEEVMRWMDAVCEKLVEAEQLFNELVADGILAKVDKADCLVPGVQPEE